MDIEELNALKEKEIQEKFLEWIQNNPSKIAFTPERFQETCYEIFKGGMQSEQQPTGNQYTGYLKEGNKTLEKVQKDEPIFVLRAQDNTAPGIILNWIAKNLDTVDEAKLKEAFQTALAMRRYSFRRDPT